MKTTGFGSSATNRKPQVAGKFYPGNKQELWKELNNLFQLAKPLAKKNQQIRAIIAPHAGYIFSGKVAASAFNQIPENATFKNIFIIASSHRFSFKGAAVFISGNYETPLGEIQVNTQIGEQLINCSPFFTEHIGAHQFEHSLEVLLPFLQKKLSSAFQIVPLILGTSDKNECREIAKKLKPYFNTENLFVVSTDFSHYPDYSDACETDKLTAETICQNKPKQLLNTLESNKIRNIKNLATSLCGWASVLTLLHITKKEDYVFEKIDYQNSGDAINYGDKKQVVGYWALAVYKNINRHFEVNRQEKQNIITLAKNAIYKYTKGENYNDKKIKPEGILKEKTGVFVSIYIKNKLRGCIGGFPQEKTLYNLLEKMAVSAACDKRFEKPKPDELDYMELEISLISPLKKIQSVDEIELGKHGIYIKRGYNTGTFLPQVATKTGWSLTEFLGHCARDKAQIGWDGWKTADIYIYEALIFKG